MMNRILIVDDDDLVRLTLEHVLGAAGYLIASATNGKQGIAVFKTFGPHLIITDMMMPLMTGVEMIIAIKKREPRLKIIAMSGGATSGRDDLLQKAQEQGADFIIWKPFEIEEVLSLVRRCLSTPGAG